MTLRRFAFLSFFALALSGNAACSIDDDARCGDGQIFDTVTRACTGTGVLGDACASAGDCSTAADVCLPTGLAEPAGLCTVSYCGSGADCGSPAFGCCNCASAPQPPLPIPLCVPVTSTAALTLAGCTCS